MLIQNQISKEKSLEKFKKLDDNSNVADAGNNQSMFFSTVLENIKETRLKFSEGSVTVL